MIPGIQSKMKNCICKFSNQKLSYNGSTTTNLKKHWNEIDKMELSSAEASRKRAAEDNHEDAAPEKVKVQMDIRKSFSNIFLNKASENKVVWLVVKQGKSFQLAESKEFQELIFFIC
jgi:hypothetical protein